MNISENDWKLFKSRAGGWQENYMEKLNNEYIEILSQNKNASEKFWELEKRIYKDKKCAGVVIQLRRSTAYYDIANLISCGAITYDDLDDFSDELISVIKTITK